MKQHKHIFSYISEALFALTLLSAILLSSPFVSADTSVDDDIKIKIPITCNLSSTVNTAHTASITAGHYLTNIGKSTIKAACNDDEGFAIYAIGYSNNQHGNTDLIGTTNSTNTIPTDTVTTGYTSGWAMKLTPVTGTYEPTIESAFQNYTAIPTNYTKVAYKNSATDTSIGASLETTYAIYVKPTQPADTYEGQVKYTLVHPSTHTAPTSRPAMLDTGENVNRKMKNIANNTSNATKNTTDSKIRSIQTTSTLPANFEPTEANTISLSTSENPVYIYYDNTYGAGTIYVYSGGATPVLNPDSSYMFYYMNSLSTAPAISSWDTSNVTNMSYMFRAAFYNDTTFSLDLSSWDTSNVTNMSYMFANTGYNVPTYSLDLSSWDTSSVIDMSYMFYSVSYSATTFSLDLSSWDTSNVTDMSWMFDTAGYNATDWSVDGLSSWDTSSVTNMGWMFLFAGMNADAFSLNLSSWDTSNVTNMNQMFCNAGQYATTFSLNLSSWDTSNITNMGNMFNAAGMNATTFSLNLSSWDTSNVMNTGAMFSHAGQQATTWSLDLSFWDTSNLICTEEMFREAGMNATTFSLNLSSWDTSKLAYVDNMFYMAGYHANTWSVIIPQTNKNGINNTTSRMYGETTSIYAQPSGSKSFTLAQ